MTHTLLSLRRSWSSLSLPELDDLRGDWEAEFVAPLRRVAPAGLGLIGLPRWYGKRFADDGASWRGVNLLRTDGELEETMPMTVEIGLSHADDHPCVALTYPAGTRKPWPWVRDEARRLDDDTLLGMTYVDVPGLRAAGGTPFLLTRAGAAR